jgi:hypothetical protein
MLRISNESVDENIDQSGEELLILTADNFIIM